MLVGVLRRRFLFRGLCLTCHLVICLLCFLCASCNIFTLFYWLLCSRKRWGSSSFQRQCEDTVILSGRSVTDDTCSPPSGNFFVKAECSKEPMLSAPESCMAVTEWRSIQSGQRKFLPNSLQGRSWPTRTSLPPTLLLVYLVLKHFSSPLASMLCGFPEIHR